MDQSTLRLPDPASHPPRGERRRTGRHKLHTPVYVSFTGPESGMVVDLSELLDLHEDGFAVQTAIPAGKPGNDRLEVNRAVSLCLDLPETAKYVHGSGQVIWSDDSGRAGIRFSFLPDDSRQVLKEWLFANLLVASTNYAARIEQLSDHDGQRASSPAESWLPEPPSNVSPPVLDLPQAEKLFASPIAMPLAGSVSTVTADALSDRAELLSALDDLRREVRAIEASEIEAREPAAHADAVLYLITERAMSLTGAAGAALALLTDARMLCRASIGNAPPVGSEVDVRAGLSGECIRSGFLVTCEDPESDARVDPEVCRMLGIGSFMAAPIFTDFRVVGLLEIFSSSPRSFTELQGTILERLVELVPKSGEKSKHQRIEEKVLEAAPELKASPDEEMAAPARQGEQNLSVAADQAVANVATSMSTEPAPDASVRPNALDLQAAQPDAPQQDLEDEPGFASPRRSYFTHFGLPLLVLGTVAMVLGYLLAPTIQQRWMGPAQAAQTSPQASSKLSPASVSLQDSPNRPRRSLSAEDVRTLADQGDPDAQYQLGILYHDGDLVPKNDAQAVQWFERAAEQGFVRAQSALASCYWAGRGVPTDFSKAFFWSEIALAQGDENSKLLLEGLATQMTQPQVAQARQQAETWLHAHNHAAQASSN